MNSILIYLFHGLRESAYNVQSCHRHGKFVTQFRVDVDDMFRKCVGL